MSIFQAIILGLVQGLTEFLPVSSSGHLAIAQKMLGLEENLLAFDVLLHFGTLIPVIIVFWKEIWKLFKNPFQKMTLLLIIGTLPAVFAALFLGDLMDTLFSGGVFLAFAYVITGLMLIASDRVANGYKSQNEITPLDALIVGIIQAVAIIPGISRSGSTITGSLLRGFDKKTAASFSFLLSIPAILGAGVLHFKDIITGDSVLNTISPLSAAAGFLTAMLSGYIAIRFMLRLIKEKNLKVFSYYVFALAAFIVLDYFTYRLVF